MTLEHYAYGNDKPIDRTHFDLGDIVAFKGQYGRGVASMCNGTDEDDECYTICSFNLENPDSTFPEGPVPLNTILLQPTNQDLILAIETLKTDDKDAFLLNQNPKTTIFKYFCNGVLKAAKRNAIEQITNAIDGYNMVVECLAQRWMKTSDRIHYDCLIEQKELKEQVKEEKKKNSALNKRIKELEAYIKSLQYSTQETGKKNMLDIFNSDKAKKLMQKLMDEGLIDTDSQPVNLSGTERSIVAKYVSNYLEINEIWQVFGLLWDMKPETLRNYFNRSFGQKKTTLFQDRMKEIINSL